jgi:hypothetical protein
MMPCGGAETSGIVKSSDILFLVQTSPVPRKKRNAGFITVLCSASGLDKKYQKDGQGMH